ncbi:hypothetical protein DID75_02155 [Candidatus Marinamargulisbacteria bacterium SCGC AG-410-N11]|nr:hypothetical protein DID75_02155 [Candidatus Marinamargulisbacteria bacterium SCGC AG-410-N11]
MKKIISNKYQKIATDLIEKINKQPIGFRTIFSNEYFKELDVSLIYNSLVKRNQIDAIIKLATSNRNKKRNISNVTKPNTILTAKKQKTESVKKEINLSNQPLRNFKQYTNYTHIDLSNCEKATLNNWLEPFENVKNINLSGCRQITDVGLAYLTNVREINLAQCKQITDVGLALLTQVIMINLTCCYQITDVGLAKLPKSVTSINLTWCEKITDAGLAYLTSVTSINLTWCKKITNAGLAHLTKVTKINLNTCSNITNNGLAYLKSVIEISLRWCDKITDDGLNNLENLQKIDLRNTKISKQKRKELKQKGINVIG